MTTASKILILINKKHETSIVINLPSFTYTNYVLTGDNTEIDWWLIDTEKNDPELFDKIKSTLCPNKKIEGIEGLYHDIIVSDEDKDFMVQKEEEIKKLMDENYRGGLT